MGQGDVRPGVTGWVGATIAVVAISGSACSAKSKHPENPVFPAWADSEMRRAGLDKRFEVHRKVDPVYQIGDFDGDGQLDFAGLVRDRSSAKIGVLILHRAGGGAHILGAGHQFGNGGDDWSWLGAWRVVPPAQLPDSVSSSRDALLVEKPESAGGLLVWKGSEYEWIQWGD